MSVTTIFIAALAVGQADVSCNPDTLRRNSKSELRRTNRHVTGLMLVSSIKRQLIAC
jgi:hypothetical protein